MRAVSSRRTRRRRAALGGAGLLAGLVGGWLAGLLRGPRDLRRPTA